MSLICLTAVFFIPFIGKLKHQLYVTFIEVLKYILEIEYPCTDTIKPYTACSKM